MTLRENKEKFPKAIIFIPEDDIIKQTNLPIHEVCDGEHHLLLKYLLEEIHRVLASFKEKLLSKSKEEYYPHVIWIVPPHHKYFKNNEERECFRVTLESEIAKYPNMCALQLKKIWEESDGSLYLPEQRRFTDQGLHDYWKSVDSAICFWDKTLCNIMSKRQKKNPSHATAYHQKTNSRPDAKYAIDNHHLTYSKYVWHRKTSEMGGSQKLPIPPPDKPQRRY